MISLGKEPKSSKQLPKIFSSYQRIFCKVFCFSIFYDFFSILLNGILDTPHLFYLFLRDVTRLGMLCLDLTQVYPNWLGRETVLSNPTRFRFTTGSAEKNPSRIWFLRQFGPRSFWFTFIRFGPRAGPNAATGLTQRLWV